ncbi:MBL fold metallo-hydrolase [uncultured Actinomyces sp.]|uniref:MBL fold metallo-hydrolase n=1 Tax=uncultured Actinomyces sp. TaxID=249061 RepID=UPI0028F0FBA0|nr:MBL fold metallo-hydrolase [uncultured Actinomyces sp.]
MNLRHGQLWQRLGLTVLSGILVASLAPATAAAPTSGQESHGDVESVDLDLSRTDAEAAGPAASQDRAASDGADTSDASDSTDAADSTDGATASSEEERADGVDAQIYTFPGTNGPTRIHVLTTTRSADAILLESRGVFAMIDGAEGVGAPDGKDPRYPLRRGVVPGWAGDTDRVLGYMSKHGVTSSNLAFYLGTHAHSDHIDNADEIIRKFRPKVIFSPEYSDKWITNPDGLWDNQWVYDNMVDAAKWAQKTYGAQFVQKIDGYNTHVQLGDMDVQLIPFDPDETYKVKGTTDANLMGWGAKVSAFGRSAFLAADLMDTEADWSTHNGFEARVAQAVGKVDMLKAGHHGQPSSNFPPFMKALDPTAIIQTGSESYTPDNLTEKVIHGDVLWAPMSEVGSAGIASVIATLSSAGISYSDFSAASWGHEYDLESPRAWWFKGGRPAATTGWWKGFSGHWYYFAGKPSAEASTWVYDGGQWYWMDATGAMATGWIHDGKAWYYLDSAGHPSGSGWSFIDGSWYYLSGGRVATGWLYDAGSWYYLNGATGAMVTGWTQVDGQWYFLRSSGAMVTGWLNGGSAWYYLGGSGAMATGWILDHGAWYYMGDTGAMVTGTQEIDGRSSTFSASGRWVGYAS